MIYKTDEMISTPNPAVESSTQSHLNLTADATVTLDSCAFQYQDYIFPTIGKFT